MKLQNVIVASVLSLGVLFSAVAMAKPGHGGMYRMLLSERAAEHLELSEGQQMQIKAIAESQKELLAPYKEQMKAQRKLVKEIVQNASFDEDAFRNEFEKSQDLRLEVALIKAKNKNQVWNLLSEDQQETLAKLKKRMRKKAAMHKRQ